MRITSVTVGTTAGHEQQDPTAVEAYTLDTEAGLSVTVWTYGASLVAVLVPDREGRRDNVVVGCSSLAEYEEPRNRFVGSTLGRYARCIAGGLLPIGPVAHQLDRNEGGHHFHGGHIGFDRFVWDAEAHESSGRLALKLRLDRPDGDQGYPGAVHAETVYAFDDAGRLTFAHSATTSAPTVVEMTNHAYWNLAGRGTIDDHMLRVASAGVLLVDDDLIPVDLPVAVKDAGLDYRRRKRLGSSRLDHCFALDDASPAAELLHPASGRCMRIVTDQPGLQVYSGDGLVASRGGIALQTGGWPNAPRMPTFPSARLDPGQIYRHETTHEFSAMRR